MISILSQHRRAAVAIGAALFVLVMILGFTERHSLRRMLHGGGMTRAADGDLVAPSPNSNTTDPAAGSAAANSMAGVTINDEGLPIAKGQETYTQFEAQRAAASKGQSFDGDHCKTDCSEQQKGYVWAKAHAIKTSGECAEQADKAYDGCVVYAREQEHAAQDEQLKKSYLDMVEKGLPGGAGNGN